MQQLGNLNLIGFKVGELTGSIWAPPLYRDCQIYIGGECVSDCKREYLPDLASDINDEIERIRNKLNFLKYEDDRHFSVNATVLSGCFE
jgi:hypothetical protein